MPAPKEQVVSWLRRGSQREDRQHHDGTHSEKQYIHGKSRGWTVCGELAGGNGLRHSFGELHLVLAGA